MRFAKSAFNEIANDNDARNGRLLIEKQLERGRDMYGFEIAWHPIAIATVMMVLDIISGLAGAVKEGAVNSGKMREGAWHKAGYFGLIALAAAYEVAAAWINFEVAELGIGMTAPEIPAVTAVCAFVVLTEVVSIVENLCVLNPDIARLPVVKTLAKRDPAAPDVTIGVIDETVKTE